MEQILGEVIKVIVQIQFIRNNKIMKLIKYRIKKETKPNGNIRNGNIRFEPQYKHIFRGFFDGWKGSMSYLTIKEAEDTIDAWKLAFNKEKSIIEYINIE